MATWSTPLEIVRRTVGRADPVIFDVGANDGGTSELYQVMFERPTIHAFEPQPAVFAELERRFGATAGMTLNRTALGDRPGTATLHRNNDARTSSLLPLHAPSSWAQELKLETVERLEVPVDTIDRYCAAHGVAHIDLLKIDVQGFEPDCLRGAVGMLDRHAIRVMQIEVINHKTYARRTSFLDIETILAPRGYRLFSVIDVIGDARGELLVLDALYVLESEHP